MLLQGLQGASSQATRPAAAVAARLKGAARVSRHQIAAATGKNAPKSIQGRGANVLLAAHTNVAGFCNSPNVHSQGISSLQQQPPTGPPDVSWLDDAGTLEQQPNNSWRVKYTDGRTHLYVDPEGIVPYLQRRLPQLQQYRNYDPEAFNYTYLQAQRPPALIIMTGMLKTGKSHTQRIMLPALVAECLRDGRLKGPTPVLLKLDGASLDMSAGATARLWSLLRMLVEWAREFNVPVEPLAWGEAVSKQGKPPAPDDLFSLGLTIVQFFNGLRAPVLVLFDDFHNLLLPETIRDRPRVDGSSHIRDVVVRQLLIEGPRNVAWNITSSDIIMVWMAISQMSPYTLLTGNKTIKLPATFPELSMRAVWSELVDKCPHLVEELYEHAEPTPAMLTMLAAEWRVAEDPVEDVAAFAGEFMRQKLRLEAMRGWRAALESMTVRMRLIVLDLTSVLDGCDAALMGPEYGVYYVLEPYVKKNARGNYYLASPKHRQLIQMIIDIEGNIISTVPASNGSGSRRLPPIQLETQELFRQMGSAVYGVGMLETSSAQMAAPPAFANAFEELAADLDTKVSHTLWLDQAWFVKARSSPYCSITAANFARMLKSGTPSKSVMLAWFFRLMRHIVVRQKPSDAMASTYIECIVSGFAHALRVNQWELAERLEAVLALMCTTSGSAADAS